MISLSALPSPIAVAPGAGPRTTPGDAAGFPDLAALSLRQAAAAPGTTLPAMPGQSVAETVAVMAPVPEIAIASPVGARSTATPAMAGVAPAAIAPGAVPATGTVAPSAWFAAAPAGEPLADGTPTGSPGASASADLPLLDRPAPRGTNATSPRPMRSPAAAAPAMLPSIAAEPGVPDAEIAEPARTVVLPAATRAGSRSARHTAAIAEPILPAELKADPATAIVAATPTSDGPTPVPPAAPQSDGPTVPSIAAAPVRLTAATPDAPPVLAAVAPVPVIGSDLLADGRPLATATAVRSATPSPTSLAPTPPAKPGPDRTTIDRARASASPILAGSAPKTAANAVPTGIGPAADSNDDDSRAHATDPAPASPVAIAPPPAAAPTPTPEPVSVAAAPPRSTPSNPAASDPAPTARGIEPLAVMTAPVATGVTGAPSERTTVVRDADMTRPEATPGVESRPAAALAPTFAPIAPAPTAPSIASADRRRAPVIAAVALPVLADAAAMTTVAGEPASVSVPAPAPRVAPAPIVPVRSSAAPAVADAGRISDHPAAPAVAVAPAMAAIAPNAATTGRVVATPVPVADTVAPTTAATLLPMPSEAALQAVPGDGPVVSAPVAPFVPGVMATTTPPQPLVGSVLPATGSTESVTAAVVAPGTVPAIATAGPAPASLPSAAGPAGQVFAAALHAAALADRRRDTPDEASGTVAMGALSPAAANQAVAEAAPLDLRRADWPARMIDHIELLRDAADAVSTRIRISPDALGPIDVQVRRDGDQLAVHLAAAHPETRAILSDAQPQLATIAAERGVRLGQTSIGASGSTSAGSGAPGGEGARQQPAPGQSARPRPAPAAARTDSDTDDTRIA